MATTTNRHDDGPPLPGWLAVALVVGTSAAVLVLEILAARLLAPYSGVTLDTYTGIIGTVLAGIAVGAWIGGWAADHVDPRRLLPVLLVGGGALAIATIPIVRATGPVATGGGGGVLMVTAIAFLPSAAVLSAIPPAVVKLQLRDLESTGTTVGRLSAYGTAGAIVATFLTGFVLVAVAAVTTLIISVGVLLVIAGLALWALTPGRQRRTIAAEMTSMSAVAGVSLAIAVALGSPCDTQTDYYCVTIRTDDDRASGRTLVLDDLRHSYVDLDDPGHLEFWYIRRIVDAIEVSAPMDDVEIVHLGGGALTVPVWVRDERPDSEQVVLEIDGELVDVVTEEFDRVVGPGTGIDVIVGDGRLSMRDLGDGSADVVVGDAFGSRSVPWHLATSEFVADIDRVLRAEGIYVANVIDAGEQRFLRSYAATIASRFEHVAVILGPGAAVGGNGNSVIIASHAPIDAEALVARLQAVGDGGELVDDIDEFTDGAIVLTDDFAPVDQLLARTR